MTTMTRGHISSAIAVTRSASPKIRPLCASQYTQTSSASKIVEAVIAQRARHIGGAVSEIAGTGHRADSIAPVPTARTCALAVAAGVAGSTATARPQHAADANAVRAGGRSTRNPAAVPTWQTAPRTNPTDITDPPRSVSAGALMVSPMGLWDAASVERAIGSVITGTLGAAIAKTGVQRATGDRAVAGCM